jgi:uncharacterized protein
VRRLCAIAVCCGVMLAACVPYSVRTLDFRQAFLAGLPASALLHLEEHRSSSKSPDRALYELNKGMLLHVTGDFAGSNEWLEKAKVRMQQLAATSITENLTALTVNEATRSYAGQPYEQLSLYAYKALNYLLLGKPDDARVEVLQADVRLREWEDAGELRAFEASAFVRYVSGLVFEMSREWDDALIAYRKAYNVYKKTKNPVPLQLQKDLLRLSSFRGRKDELAQYVKEFRGTDWESMKSLQSKAELVVFVHHGAVSVMQEHMVFNYSPELKYQVQVAVPYYLPRSDFVSQTGVQLSGAMRPAELLQDVDALARKDLESRMAGITLRAVARMVLKKKISKEAAKEDGFAGFIANMAGILTERADTRSWITLPDSIHLLRLSLPPGEHAVGFGGLQSDRVMPLTAGGVTVLSLHGLTGRNIYAVH